MPVSQFRREKARHSVRGSQVQNPGAERLVSPFGDWIPFLGLLPQNVMHWMAERPVLSRSWRPAVRAQSVGRALPS